MATESPLDQPGRSPQRASDYEPGKSAIHLSSVKGNRPLAINVYTVLLLLAFVAIATGTCFLFLQLRRYDFEMKPSAKAEVTTSAKQISLNEVPHYS